MDAVTAVLAVVYSAIVGFAFYCGIEWLRCRVSPKYAAKRELRNAASADRRLARLRARNTANGGRLHAWAVAHQGDPVAKALLASREVSVAAVPTASQDDDPLTVLRRRQQAADDLASQMEQRKVAEALQAQRLLDWAVANSSVPEAQRHLVEVMMASSQQIEQAKRDIRIWSFSVGTADGIEAIEFGTKLSDAEARKTAAERRITSIQAALATSREK